MTSLLPPSFRGSLPSSRCHPSESLELAGCTAGDPPVQMSRATTVEVALILRAMPDGESSGRPAWSPLVWGMASRSLVSSATRCHPLVLFFTLNREDFSFVIHLDRQPRTSRRREAQTGSRARSGSRSERTLDAVEHSRTLMEWWPFLIFHRGGLRIKVINNSWSRGDPFSGHAIRKGLEVFAAPKFEAIGTGKPKGSSTCPEVISVGSR